MNLQLKQTTLTIDFFRSALCSVVDRICCGRNQERRGFTNHPRNAEITIPRNAHRAVVSKGRYSHILPAPHYIHPRVQRFVVSVSTIYLPRSRTLDFSNLITRSEIGLKCNKIIHLNMSEVLRKKNIEERKRIFVLYKRDYCRYAEVFSY